MGKRREINGQVRSWSGNGDQCLAFTAGQGKLIDFARIGQSFATSDHAHDVDYFPRALQGTSKGTPCHPSMTCGPLTPSPSTKRFCERADMVSSQSEAITQPASQL